MLADFENIYLGDMSVCLAIVDERNNSLLWKSHPLQCSSDIPLSAALSEELWGMIKTCPVTALRQCNNGVNLYVKAQAKAKEQIGYFQRNHNFYK